MVDFELLSGAPKPLGPEDQLERLLFGDRRTRQFWVSQPPHLWSLGVFLLFALEIMLAHRLVSDAGAGREVWRHFLSVAVTLLFLEGLYGIVATQGAMLFGKKGSFGTLITLFHCALA